MCEGGLILRVCSITALKSVFFFHALQHLLCHFSQANNVQFCIETKQY